jgi:L-iditol 2-dehydrogenase
LKAVMKTVAAPGGIEVRETEPPRPGPGEVLIDVEFGGICGSDLHIYDWDPGYRGIGVPRILGHEFGGTVSALGAGSDPDMRGRRVVVESTVDCGHCRFCLDGRPYLCRDGIVLGITRDGGLADQAVVPSASALVVDDDLPGRLLPLVQVLAIACSAVADSAFRVGDLATVIGCGPVGLCLALALRAGGASRVLVTGLAPDEELRLPIARALGVDVAVVADTDDGFDALDAAPADVVFEASGSRSGVVHAVAAAGRGGEVVVVGISNQRPGLPVRRLVMDRLVVRGHLRRTFAGWRRAMALASRHSDELMGLITRCVPASDSAGVPDAFARLRAQQEAKIIISFDSAG